MLFVCYPKCSTCMKAKKWLEEKEIEFEQRDIKEEKPTAEELIELLASDGMLVKRPILMQNEKVLVGFKEKEWQEIL